MRIHADLEPQPCTEGSPFFSNYCLFLLGINAVHFVLLIFLCVYLPCRASRRHRDYEAQAHPHPPEQDRPHQGGPGQLGFQPVFRIRIGSGFRGLLDPDSDPKIQGLKIGQIC